MATEKQRAKWRKQYRTNKLKKNVLLGKEEALVKVGRKLPKRLPKFKAKRKYARKAHREDVNNVFVSSIPLDAVPERKGYLSDGRKHAPRLPPLLPRARLIRIIQLLAQELGG